MSGGKALALAREAGIDIRVSGDRLLLTARTTPPPEVRALLQLHKPQVISLLRGGRDGWTGEDWLHEYEERAAIIEHDGGLPRHEAEARAYDCCIVEWLDRNFEPSPPGHCLHCGRGDLEADPLLPFGTERTGHAWLHGHCWPDWTSGRKAEAVRAFSAIGVTRRA